MSSNKTLNIKELEKFRENLHNLVDDFHHAIYLNDDIFEGIGIILNAIDNQITKNK